MIYRKFIPAYASAFLLLAITMTYAALQPSNTSSPPPHSKPTKWKWIVRPVTPSDELPISDLLYKSYSTLLAADYSPDLLAESLPLLTRAQPALLNCPTYYVVQHPDSHEIVGCGGWTRQPPGLKKNVTPRMNESSAAASESRGQRESSEIPHLRHFATDPSLTRCGIGRALWNRIWADVCREMGDDTELEVFSTLTAAPFYRSLGFQEEQATEIQFTPSIQFPCFLMRRRTEYQNNKSL